MVVIYFLLAWWVGGVQGLWLLSAGEESPSLSRHLEQEESRSKTVSRLSGRPDRSKADVPKWLHDQLSYTCLIPGILNSGSGNDFRNLHFLFNSGN